MNDKKRIREEGLEVVDEEASYREGKVMVTISLDELTTLRNENATLKRKVDELFEELDELHAQAERATQKGVVH